MTKRTLHILRKPPVETIRRLIDEYYLDDWASVVCLYEDDVSGRPVNWLRIVDDIFAHEKIICWW